jgi:hypothetical protein
MGDRPRWRPNIARLAVVGGALVAALVSAAPSQPSELIARNARDLHLAVNERGEALVTYRREGLLRHVLLWGAVNARPPRASARQVEFQVDYSGGWRRYHRAYWRDFDGTCGRYDGPPLAFSVAACKAPDGSYWAVQSPPQPGAAHTEFEVSHWHGPPAKMQTGMAWAYDGRVQVIFGRVTYAGQPVYGFGTTRRGAPTDGFGRLVYLDSFNSTHGPGWRRENSFVTHKRTGAFCYGLHPSGGGPGSKYRLFVSGPGVTPLVVATVPGWHDFNRSRPADVARQKGAAARLRSWGVSSTDKDCGPVLRMAANLLGRRGAGR